MSNGRDKEGDKAIVRPMTSAKEETGSWMRNAGCGEAALDTRIGMEMGVLVGCITRVHCPQMRVRFVRSVEYDPSDECREGAATTSRRVK